MNVIVALGICQPPSPSLSICKVCFSFSVYDIEKRAKAPKKFQFPRFEAMNWYAGTELLEDLNEGLLDNMPALYLINVKCLFKNLIQWAKDREVSKKGILKGYSFYVGVRLGLGLAA